MVHLLFPRHRVDAPHETRVRPATVLLHFCLPILRASPPSLLSFCPLSPARSSSLLSLARARVSIACTRAPLSREHAAVFCWLSTRKSGKVPRAHRAVREVAHWKRNATTEIKVSIRGLCFTLYGARTREREKPRGRERKTISRNARRYRTFCFNFDVALASPARRPVTTVFRHFCNVLLDFTSDSTNVVESVRRRLV